MNKPYAQIAAQNSFMDIYINKHLILKQQMQYILPQKAWNINILVTTQTIRSG